MKFTPGIMAVSKVTAPVLWTPLSLGSSLKVWLNADSHGTGEMTDDGAGLISMWGNTVGALSVTAGTTARPTWTSNAFNTSYAGLTFNGTTNCLTTTTLTEVPTGATPGELYAISSYSLPGSTAAQAMIVRYGLGAGATRTLGRFNTANVNRAFVGDGTGNLVDTAIDFSGPHIVSGTFSGTTVTGRIDGRDTAPATATVATLNTSTARFRIGAASAAGPAQFWPGSVRHVMVMDILTGTDREKLEGWGAHDSGLTGNLPGGHPYKTLPPYV